MKKLLVIIATALTLFVSSCSSTEIQQPLVLHENPSTASSQYALVSLLSSYSMVFELILNGSYVNLATILADLKQANLSSEMKLLFDRYNQLSSDLTIALDTIESTLDMATGQINQGDLAHAEISLERAATLLSGIALVPAEISEVTSNIGVNLGISALGDSTELKLAYNRLVVAGSRLEQAVTRLAELEQSLRERRKLFESTLLPTTISLSTSPVTAFVGDEVKFFGRVTSLDIPLSERPLTINFAGRQIKVTTDAMGNYSLNANLPYSYVPSLTAQAIYSPAGRDNGVYQASSSPDFVINTKYYQTSIEVTLPDAVYPGKQFELRGRLSSNGEVTPRTLRVLLGGHVLATFSAIDNFVVSLTPPEDMALSTYRMTFEVLAIGRYSGAAKSSETELTLMPLTTSVDVQGFVSLPGKLIITGFVKSANEVPADAHVVIDFPEAATLAVDTASGIIAAEIPLPLGLSFSGTHYLDITINPAEPWYESQSLKMRVFVFNPLTAASMLIICLIILLVGIISSHKKSASNMHTADVFGEERISVPTPGAPAISHYNPGGISESIINTYLVAREAISSMTGIFIAPGNTLREFLARCIKFLPWLRQAFGDLTELVEKVLYSGVQLGRDSLDKASAWARIILKRGKRGHP